MFVTRRTRARRPAAAPLAQVQRLEGRTLFNSVAHFDTNLGGFDVELFDAQKPLSVANFIKVASRGLYRNTLIHRSANLAGLPSPAPKQIIQGGGYGGTSGLPAIKDPFPAVPDELTVNGQNHNARGSFAYAKSGPNTATTQWFVNATDNSADLDPAENSGGFTVFGQVSADTLPVIDAIAALPTSDLAPGKSTPFTDVPLSGSSGVIVNSVTFSQLDVTLGAGGFSSIAFVDADGTRGTLALAGPGSATVHFTGSGLLRGDRGHKTTLAGSVSGIGDLSVTGTTARTSIKLTGRRGSDGSFAVGTIGTNGPLRSLATSGVAIGGSINVGGGLGTLSLGNGLTTNVSATSIGTLSVKGGVTNSTIALSAGLGKANVTGAITNSTINVATTIRSLTAGGLTGSNVYAGANLPSGGLPASVADLPTTSGSIGSVRVKTFAGSDVAAFSLGKLALGAVSVTNNGTPFGVGAHTIASLTATLTPGGKLSLKKIADPIVLAQTLQQRGIDLMDARIVIV